MNFYEEAALETPIYLFLVLAPLNICTFRAPGLKVTPQRQPQLELHMGYTDNSQLLHSDPWGMPNLLGLFFFSHKREAQTGGTNKNMEIKWIFPRATKRFASLCLQFLVRCTQRLRGT